MANPNPKLKLAPKPSEGEPTRAEIFTARLDQGHREAANSYRENVWKPYQHPAKRNPVLRPDEVLNVGQRSSADDLRGHYAARAVVGIGTIPLWRRLLGRLRG